MRIILVLLFIASISAYGQNLETIGKEKPLSISGGLSLNQILYTANGISSRRDPYTYYASGNINFGLYGWSVPLSFTLSNQNISYQQPFNQYGLHPTYKWATAHIGYASMSFSPYTVNGHLFKGVGIELAPTDKLKLSAMYGRFLRAVEPDTLSENPPASAFKRMGYGLKVHYGDNKHFGEFTLFRAKDDTTSISYIPENDGVLPQENLVFSFGGGVTIIKKIQFKAELASSAITRDIRASESDGQSFFGSVGSIFTPRTSSSYYKAIKSSINYTGNGYTIGVGYERIDPEYTTLGAYYFNNDLENITVNGATSLAGGKVNLSANVGTQRDNLDRSKISTLRRIVSALTIGFTPNERLNLSANYSNFQSYTNIRSQFVNINQLTPYDNLDTLNFTQLTQNLSLNGNYLLPGSDKKRQTISTNISIMKAADEQGGVSQNSGSTFYNTNAAYSINIVPKNLTLSASLNYSSNKALSAKTSTFGPNVSISKSLFDKKVRVTSSYSMNNSYTEGRLLNKVNSLRSNVSYSVKQKHNFNLSMVALNRTIKQETGTGDFTEFTGTLGYSYTF